MAVNGCSCREPFCPKCWPAPTASSEMSRLMDKCVELTAENQRLREDQRRLEWLVQQKASVCHVFGMWDVWYDEESRASEHGFGDWREAIDVAMEDSND
jgi:uncharacterized protein YggL (DUF469 family)